MCIEYEPAEFGGRTLGIGTTPEPLLGAQLVAMVAGRRRYCRQTQRVA